MSLRLVACVLAASLAASPAGRAGQAADELLAALQSRLTQGQPVDDLTPSLEELESPEMKALIADLDRAWPRFRSSYLDQLRSAASGKGGAAAEKKSRIRELRGRFNQVKGLPEGAMKAQLKQVSKPALDELQRLVSPTPGEIVGGGGETLGTLRKSTQSFATFRDAALDAALSTTPSDSRATLASAEQEVAQASSGIDRANLRILAKNRDIADDADIPAEEAAGIEECNLWRLYVGLNALTLDPKLCEAARGHSKDMAEHGFFAHDSPIPGRTTPWDRARQAGTTASAENIYAGGSNPQGANKGWFFSPGHHKNMFGKHQRIGLGHHQGKWTQLFGR